MPRIAVIIPYYQHDAALLDNSLGSILRQEGLGTWFTVEVIVVDDASPVPASAAARLDSFSPPHALTVIRQENRGCAGARNTGLDAVGSDVDIVAFLDSDDEWSQDHLANAVTALTKGYSFYFADHRRADWRDGKFTMRGLSFEGMTQIDRERRIYEYDRDIWADGFERILIQASTVAYRHDTYPQLRFLELGVHSDEPFYGELQRLGGKGAICSRVESIMGRGVNVSVVEQTCDDKALGLALHFVRYWDRLPREIFVDDRHQEIVLKKRADARREFVLLLFARLKMRRTRGADIGAALRAMRYDPKILPTFLAAAAGTAGRGVSRLFRSSEPPPDRLGDQPGQRTENLR